MLKNSDIKKLLKQGQLKQFALFLGMHPNGLSKRLKNDNILFSLHPAYEMFLKREARK